MRSWLWMSAGVRGALVVERSPSARWGEDHDVASGRRSLAAPLVYDYAEGSRARDMIDTTDGNTLVSERLVAALRACGATGWSTYPVRVTGRNGRPLKGYEGLVVAGRCGPLDERNLPRRWAPPPVPGGKEAYVWVGFRFDETTWDRTDVFRPEGTMLTFVTERVADSLRRARLLNAYIKPFEEVEHLSVEVDGQMQYAPMRSPGGRRLAPARLAKRVLRRLSLRD